MVESEKAEVAINPYASPQAPPISFAINLDDNELQAQLRTFVGPNANKYLVKWAPALTSARRRPGFNFAAFVLQGIWLAYRKMYKAALVYYVLMLGLNFFMLVLEFSFSNGFSPPPLDRAIGFGVAIVCGAAGNGWYLAHAKRAIAAARAEGLEGDALLTALSKRGGTNLLASLGMLGLFFLAVMGIAVVVEILAPSAPLGGPSSIRQV